MDWIVAVTEPRAEAKAASYVGAGGFQTYLPIIRQRVISGGKKIWKEGVFFPRYLFVQIEGQWRFLLSTIGITNVIRFTEDKPAVLPSNIIRDMKSREKDGCIQVPAPHLCMKGQRVRIRSGCFSGYAGIYQGIDSFNREIVLLNMLGREARVSVNTGLLEPIPS